MYCYKAPTARRYWQTEDVNCSLARNRPSCRPIN